jgi:hypothetical protein
MASVIENINAAMPSQLNKTSEEYLAIFGDENFTPSDPIEESSDYNCGAIANELEYSLGYTDFITRFTTIDVLYGEYLETIVAAFTGLVRTAGETDESLINRFESLIIRKENSSWMTTWMIKDVFSYFFDESIIYVIENYVTDNFIDDESFELSGWSKTQSGSTVVDFVGNDQFDFGNCAESQIDSSGSSGTIYQTMGTTVPVANYMLSFFLKDDGLLTLQDEIVKVYLQRNSDSFYYNFEDKVWQAGSAFWTVNKTTAGEYEIRQALVKMPVEDDITITFENYGGSSEAHTFWIDHVEFGTKVNYGRVKVMLLNIGDSAEFLSVWEGTGDPIPGLDYDIASYFGQAFISGFGGLGTLLYYQNLLNIIKTSGVEATVEVVSRSA